MGCGNWGESRTGVRGRTPSPPTPLPRSACEGGNLCFELFMNSGVSAFLQRDGDGAGTGTDKQNSPVHLSRGTGLWRNSAMLRAGHFAMTRAISRTLLE